MKIELVVALGSQLVALFPLVLRSCTEYLKYGVNLIELTRPWKDRHAKKELCHNTPDGPDVACWSIEVSSQGTFGCTIPSSRHICSIWRLHITHISRGTEIDHFHSLSISIDYEILRLNISMKKPSLMKIVYSDENLLHDDADFLLGEPPLILSQLLFHKFSEIHVTVLKHYIKSTIIIFDPLGVNYVRVLPQLHQAAEDLDLTDI